MNLVIISHTQHYLDQGQIKGWGPTIREISYLAELFDNVTHIAPLYDEPAPPSALAYQPPGVHLHLIKPSGGAGFRSKAGVVARIPGYLWAMWGEIRKADIVHVRCPANISLLAVLLLSLMPRPRIRWVKYAGNWRPTGREAVSYTLQRFWLNAGLQRGVVTVNGHWPDQPAHVHTFLNPCLTDDELDEAQHQAAQRQLSKPIGLLFVGQLNSIKGVGRALDILAALQARQVAATLDLVGDGPERLQFEAQARSLNISDKVTFHGWLPRPALGSLYANAHISLFPTRSSEGWPKVLSEAMAYGVVPVSGNVSSIPQYLQDFQTGRALPPEDISAFADAILWYSEHPKDWQREVCKRRQSRAIIQLFKVCGCSSELAEYQ